MNARPFTGWHMTTILVGFFGVVIAVNLVMARYALGTFGGTVVDNSYVASQKFNGWLEKAEGERKLGWDIKASLNADRHVVVTVTKSGAALEGLTASASAHHPLGRMPEQAIQFSPLSGGGMISTAPLPAGRWQLKLSVSKDGNTVRVLEAF